MRLLQSAALGLVVLIVVGCGDDATVGVEPVFDNEVNRFSMEIGDGIDIAEAGGLICKVEDGTLTLDFSPDMADGQPGYTYEARYPNFSAEDPRFDGTIEVTSADGMTWVGKTSMTFSYGDPPEGYFGVVRAAGAIRSTSDDAGSLQINGTYACFLTDAEVGL
jgi:hypothetical protein